MKNVYTPNDFAHLATDSAMIQAAVDEARKYGSRVEIPRYNERTGKCLWELDESIKLYTGSAVLLDNCHIRLCDGKYINFFTNSASASWREEVNSADRQYDISLTGLGNAVLDGGNPVDMCEGDFNIYDAQGNFVKSVFVNGIRSMWENIGLRFVNVERITVSNIRMINIRYWAMAFWFCSSGVVRDIRIEAFNNVPNQDGINIRLGSHNFLIENIEGLIGDDTVSVNSLDRHRFGTSDMPDDIHDITIRNIRSRQTGECDLIRILGRGGTPIYNVLIDGVFDLTNPGEKDRPLAAIRIGDLCAYPARRNQLGETRNIVVRNVVTRARFGAYVADTVADTLFDSLKIYGDGGIGMYFNGCQLKNVTVRNLGYDVTAKAPDTDIGYGEIFHRVKIDQLNAVHFNNCQAENVTFDGLVTGRNLSYVFGGNSPITVKASNIAIADENTALTENVTVTER